MEWPRRSVQKHLILEAADGKAALSAIRESAPDLVFLDLNMPQFDGMYVLQELQRDQQTPDSRKLLSVTANDGVNYAVECIRCGATDFVTKPYDIEHLRSMVKN